MTPNDLLLAHLAAVSDDATLIRAMSSAVFGLTGEIGDVGFGATTLEDHLVLFTHPEFHAVAGLPPGLEAVEATARQAAEYARAVGLVGYVVNPGTHQRFLRGDLLASLRPPEPPAVPPLAPLVSPAPDLVEAVAAAAEDSLVEAAWLAAGRIVVTRPHPDPAFEAALLAGEVRLRSFAASPEWSPVFERAAPDRERIRLGPLPYVLDPALARDLAAHARIHHLRELWTFAATVGDGDPTLALAYAPHPHDAFAADFNVLHARHGLGADVPLLSAETLREALPRVGAKLA